MSRLFSQKTQDNQSHEQRDGLFLNGSVARPTARMVLTYLGVMFGLTGFFFIWPQIDILIANLFYLAEEKVFVANGEKINKVRDAVEYAGWIAAFIILIGLGSHWILRRHFMKSLRGRRVTFLVVSALIGPGLIVSIILKENWGRARPYQISHFQQHEGAFTPPWVPSRACPRNCSFVSGDVALAAWFSAFAFIWSTAKGRRRWAYGFVTFTALVALLRMVMGKHFFSDVLFSALITFGVNWCLYHLMVAQRWALFRQWWEDWLGPNAGQKP